MFRTLHLYIMDPMTIMTCIQVASSVAGMLSPKGPDIADLINIQTQMLKNISNQISKLQDGINVIIQDIDALKKFVKYDLPSEIYKTFVTNELVANFAGYDRTTNAYIFDLQHLGILESYKRNKDDLHRTLIDIQKKRDELFRHKDYFLAPLVARCFKIEIDLMIILYPEFTSPGKFYASFLDYENWLMDLQDSTKSFSVDSHIDLLKRDLEVANQNTYGFRMCKLSERQEHGEFEPNLGYFDKYFYDITVEYFSFKRVFNPEVEQQMIKQNFNYEELTSIYDALEIDLKFIPSVVSQTVDEKLKQEPLELAFTDEFYNGIPQDGQPPYRFIDSYKDERFDVERKFFEDLNTCDNPAPQILTNKRYFDAVKAVEKVGMQIIIPISQKKVMFEIQNKIGQLRTVI